MDQSPAIGGVLRNLQNAAGETGNWHDQSLDVSPCEA